MMLAYIPPAPLVAVLREQFDYLLREGIGGKARTEDLDRLAEVSAILLDPFRNPREGTK